MDEAELSLPRRVIRYRRPSGVVVYFAQEARPGSSMWRYFAQGNQPRFERGVTTELVDVDGSSDFADLFERVREAPVVSREGS